MLPTQLQANLSLVHRHEEVAQLWTLVILSGFLVVRFHKQLEKTHSSLLGVGCNYCFIMTSTNNLDVLRSFLIL